MRRLLVAATLTLIAALGVMATAPFRSSARSTAGITVTYPAALSAAAPVSDPGYGAEFMRGVYAAQDAADAAQERAVEDARIKASGGAAGSTPATSSAAAPNLESPAPNPSSDVGAFLACVRQRESGGQYAIATGNGYFGAYQFLQSTWDNTAAHAGRNDLVGRRPSDASPADQDAMAQALYAWQGSAPWAGGNYAC